MRSGPGARRDFYERFVRSERYRAERARKARVILGLCGDRLKEAGRAADLGSGTGLIKKTLETTLDKYIYGFELDVTFIEWGRGTVAADVCRLPVADGTFDFLLLNHLYEHVGDQGALFREAYRVLDEGGAAYVSAGNALAVMEPHYRLPFLSWLPRRLADAYLRLTGRGWAYEGIRFRSYRALHGVMRQAGFRVEDLTERALETLIGPQRGRRWLLARALLRRLPGRARRRLLQRLSPQWFFLLRKPSGGMERSRPADAREVA